MASTERPFAGAPVAPDGSGPGGPLHRGDEAPAGAPGTGEDVCPGCGGSGRVQGSTCSECDGTGTVVRGIGGG